MVYLTYHIVTINIINIAKKSKYLDVVSSQNQKRASVSDRFALFNLISHHKRLAIILMYCNRLYAW